MLAAQNIGGVVAKLMVEVGKALGKAVIAGVGLELARSASGRVKKIVGPKDDPALEEGESDDAPTKVPKAAKKKAAAGGDDDDTVDVVAELRRIQRENAELRREVQALRDKDGTSRGSGADAVAVDAIDDTTL
jgi:hypothetical protein